MEIYICLILITFCNIDEIILLKRCKFCELIYFLEENLR